MTRSIKKRMYRKIVILIFLILTALTATIANKIKTINLPENEAGESKVEISGS